MSDILHQNGGRRSGIERRQFSYTQHIPEQRSAKDRRRGNDRRKNPEHRNNSNRQGHFALSFVISTLLISAMDQSFT